MKWRRNEIEEPVIRKDSSVSEHNHRETIKNVEQQVKEHIVVEKQYRSPNLWLTLTIVILVVIIIVGYSGLKVDAAKQIDLAYQTGVEDGNAQADVVYIERPGETVTISSETIAEGLKNIGELVTQEYNYTRVNNFSNTQTMELFGSNIELPWTTAKYIYSYDGVIKAGINFEEAAVEKNDETREIIIALPKAKVISHELLLDSFELYDEVQNVFNQFSISNFNESNANLKSEALTRALNNGLLEAAASNAEFMITTFVKSGFDLQDFNVIVQWK